MKILMTTDTVGGVWTYSMELSRALAAYDVRVVLAAKGRLNDSQRSQAEAVPNLSLVVEDFALEWMTDPWDDVEAAGDWLLAVAEMCRPDVIHLNDYCHGSLPWSAPVLVVGHSCVLSWMAATGGVDADERWERYRDAVTRGLRSAGLVVAPTRHMLEALRYFYGPLPHSRVIYNGCGAGRYSICRKQPFVFSAGRFRDEAKNIAALAAAAPQLDWPVAVAGLESPDGGHPDAHHLEWLGQLSPDDMAHAYSSASIYALPALYEPFGLTVLEAALSGCALVLGDIPSLREIWGDAALYVSPRDVRQLTTVINGLIRNAGLRARLGRRAYLRAQSLTAENMAAEYHRQYRQLLATAASRAVVQRIR